jgi:hypothetical protein
MAAFVIWIMQEKNLWSQKCVVYVCISIIEATGSGGGYRSFVVQNWANRIRFHLTRLFCRKARCIILSRVLVTSNGYTCYSM